MISQVARLEAVLKRLEGRVGDGKRVGGGLGEGRLGEGEAGEGEGREDLMVRLARATARMEACTA